MTKAHKEFYECAEKRCMKMRGAFRSLGLAMLKSMKDDLRRAELYEIAEGKKSEKRSDHIKSAVKLYDRIMKIPTDGTVRAETCNIEYR